MRQLQADTLHAQLLMMSSLLAVVVCGDEYDVGSTLSVIQSCVKYHVPQIVTQPQ